VQLKGTRAGLLIGLGLIAVVSQFFRSSLGVIAPELVRDLALSPQALGLAGGVFFLALGVVQIPVGMSFDRVGPRRTVAWISAFAVAGALWMSVARTGPELIAGRFLVGIGCAASFMSVVLLMIRWYPGDRVATMYARVFAASQLGNFMAATPMAWMSEAFGWRAVFGGSAVAVVAVTGFFVWAVRDQPPGQAPISARGETLVQALRGYLEVLKLPEWKKVVAVHVVAYATLATVLGLWAGPYLHDVHGLDSVGRGHVLLAMSAAQVAGMLWLVPLERRLNTRKGVILAAGCGVVAILLVLAALAEPPLWLAVALLVALCGVSTYSPIIIAHAASLVPVTLQGRGGAAANMGQVAGSFALPVLTGAIAGLFARTEAGYPAEAYRWIFVFMAAALASGLAVYSRARDLKPRGGP
jgi:MFS family permease